MIVTRRLGCIFRTNGRVLIVAFDHGMIAGPTRGMEQPAETLAQIVQGGADVILTTVGIATRFAYEIARLGLILRLVAGSTLLADVRRPHEKGRVQDLADAVVNVASSVGSLGGGFVFAATSYTMMSWIGLAAALIPLLLVILLRSIRSEVSLEGTVAG